MMKKENIFISDTLSSLQIVSLTHMHNTSNGYYACSCDTEKPLYNMVHYRSWILGHVLKVDKKNIVFNQKCIDDIEK